MLAGGGRTDPYVKEAKRSNHTGTDAGCPPLVGLSHAAGLRLAQWARQPGVSHKVAATPEKVGLFFCKCPFLTMS